jgi:sulfatase modifying factor 1
MVPCAPPARGGHRGVAPRYAERVRLLLVVGSVALALTGCSLIGLEDLQSGVTGSGGAGSMTTSTGSSSSSSPSSSGADMTTGTAMAGPCPADMILASNAALGVSFCIDATEATQADYLAFLLAVGDASGITQPPECAFNVALKNPVPGCPKFDAGNDLPIYCVDWCDARAYCAWAGKRMCGKIGGGPETPLTAELAQEEWNFACTGGLATKYPYGDTPMVGACNIPQENTPSDATDDETKTAVGSLAGCQGGFPGIFDMQGNVAEWVDWCDPATDGTGSAACYVRGGHTFGSAEYWTCANLFETHPRNEPVIEVGIRCCKDALP